MSRIVFIISIFYLTSVWSAEPPFQRGINLTGWFQTSGARQVQISKYTRQDFLNIKCLGCDVIRLPVNLHFMTSGAPDYIIDSLFYYFFDHVVDLAEELDLHLILDNHTFDVTANTDPEIGDVLVPVWTQVAEHYKDRSMYLYYEVLNEPHGIADAAWNEIQQEVIDAIRAVDQAHTIIVGPAGWNSYNNLKYMPVYTDNNLIYTFHFYDPFLFTHQGASWTDPSMVPLAGIPFPYNAAEMPGFPSELTGTWLQNSFYNYNNDGTVRRVKQLIDIAVSFKTERDIPLFCGEFGVFIPNSDNDDRVAWYDTVRSYLEEKEIAWTIWDYQGGFGLFEKGSSEQFDYDLNIPLVEALGLNPPPQSEFVLKPDSAGFDLYTDYIGERINESSWAADGIVDYYSRENPGDGNYCIYWSEVDQYCHIGFTFQPLKDLTWLVDNGYAIDFQVRGDSPGAQFDIRFIDTKTDDPDDHPWRMRRTIDESVATWNGEWHLVQIPLSEFVEHGSWDGQWYSPRGDFDWSAVEHFQIVSEHHDLSGIQFWFDDIRIIDPQTADMQHNDTLPVTFRLDQNYPNPFNAQTAIGYWLLAVSHIKLRIYNVLGQEIITLVNENQQPGYHTVDWNAGDFPSGIYYARLTTQSPRSAVDSRLLKISSQTRKLILVK